VTVEATWDEYYRDECDAAYLYGALADTEPDAARRELFERLAEVERRHVERWRRLFAESGRGVPAHRPSARVRALAWMGRRFGSSAVLPLVVAEEGREVQAYLRLADAQAATPVRAAAMTLAADSAAHARELALALGRRGEPWHASAVGGYLRSLVYGFNDGLTANFGLVAGVVGADVAPAVVAVTGIAGAIADALSMGASGYLAAKSEAEVRTHQITMERHELALMPEEEEAELALIYEARGMSAEQARQAARALMQHPTQALDAKVREELDLPGTSLSPLADGVITGAATAIGAFIPIAPFLLVDAGLAVWVSLTVSMIAHFLVGAARSLFTGRSVWASGRDMFLVGMGVAVVGYVIGELLTRML
jgi:VIT1/CCC1 family predicted Fe2+/Mn2+ transporter/rubrerythrin